MTFELAENLWDGNPCTTQLFWGTLSIDEDVCQHGSRLSVKACGQGNTA